MLDRCLRIHAEGLAWGGGVLVGEGDRRIPLGEADLRPFCRDLVRSGGAWLHLPAGQPSPGRRGFSAMVERIYLPAPAAEGVAAGTGWLERAGFDPVVFAALADRADRHAVARQRLALLIAQVVEDLHLSLSLLDQQRVDRARPEVLARSLFDFWRAVHRDRTALAAAVDGALGEAPAGTGRHFAWAVDWRSECAFGEPGGGGPIYQVFRRAGIRLTPFARAFEAAAAEGGIDPAQRKRQARYFDSSSSKA